MVAVDFPVSVTADASGNATATIRPTSRQTWTVSQVSINMPNAGGSASCGLYKNGFLISPLVPQADAASGDPPVVLHTGDTMTVQWVGAAVGATGSVVVIYDDGNG